LEIIPRAKLSGTMKQINNTLKFAVKFFQSVYWGLYP
jgi:hypothetical protein